MNQNNHYVPQLVLRRFGERLFVYDLKNGKLLRNKKPDEIFSEISLYPTEIEKELNEKIESSFAFILNHCILPASCDDEIVLTRKQVSIIRKFLLIEQMRVIGPDTGKLDDLFFQKLNPQDYPFEEKVIENETVRDRWLRNIKVILDSESLSAVKDNPLCTYEVYRWSCIYNYGYMGIWDTSKDGTDFIITDIGMTSEMYGPNGEGEKVEYLIKEIDKLSRSCGGRDKPAYMELLKQQIWFHENFYVFSISRTRTLVVINPFFRLYDKKEKFTRPYIWPTEISDRKLFEKNISPKLMSILGKPQYSDEDRFVYKVHSMKHDDIIWVNMLMLDRVDSFLGFASLENVSESIEKYITWYESRGLTPRNDYSLLKEMLQNP